MAYGVNAEGKLVYDEYLLNETVSIHTVIPDEVAARGEAAIKQYVSEYVTQVMRDREIHIQSRREKIHALDVTFAVSYDGRTLHGHVVSARNKPKGLFTVQLVRPIVYVGEETVYGSFLRPPSFNEIGALTNEALEEAKKLLVEIYKRQKHVKQHASKYRLAEALNRE